MKSSYSVSHQNNVHNRYCLTSVITRHPLIHQVVLGQIPYNTPGGFRVWHSWYCVEICAFNVMYIKGANT